MHRQLPTRWIAVLFFLSAVFTFIACSKEYSYEIKNSSIVDDNPPNEDSTGNGGDDSTDNDDDNDDDSTAGGGNDTASTSDINFMVKATHINLAQIADDALAVERGDAKAVRDLAQAMLTRFKAAQDDMKALSATTSVDIPNLTDETHEDATGRLADLEGKTFDVSYIDYQMLELQTAINLYRAEIDNGKDDRIKAYAKKYLPYLEDFLQSASMIRQTL